MGDDGDLLAPGRAGEPARRQVVGEPGDAPVEITQGFAAGRRGVGIDHAVRAQPAEHGTDRRRGGAFQGAEAPLAQPGIAGHRQPEHGGKRSRGLHGPVQVAGVERAYRTVAELAHDGPRLPDAAGCQPGLVAVSLGQAGCVPVGLTVADEPENPCGAGVLGRCAAEHDRQRAARL